MTWTSVTDADASVHWDRDLAALAGRSLAQTFGWGRYKAAQGWTTLRWTASGDDGRPVAMVQALCRDYPGRIAVVWCPGGLAGPLEHWNAELLDRMAATAGARHLYCRAAFSRERTADDAARLRIGGWTPPRRSVSAPRTMIWDLRPGEEELLAGLGSNWRHNLHRALRRGLRVVPWNDPSVDRLAQLFKTMALYKDIRASFTSKTLTALFQSLRDRLVVYGCEGEAGAPLAVRACAVHAGCAWDLLAATSPEGRRCYASYAVFWALIRHCRGLGVTKYDLSGVDPLAAPGVYDFKRGTGAREQECLGEWQWASSGLLARAVELGMRLRPAANL